MNVKVILEITDSRNTSYNDSLERMRYLENAHRDMTEE